jgi:hypothetical protein
LLSRFQHLQTVFRRLNLEVLPEEVSGYFILSFARKHLTLHQLKPNCQDCKSNTLVKNRVTNTGNLFHAASGNYNYAPMSASGYTGPDTFTVDKNCGSSSNPYFGYLLVTVNDNNTWTGEFKAFQYDTYEKGKPHNAGANQTINGFSTRQDASGSQVVVE